MGPGNKCRDDSLGMASESLPYSHSIVPGGFEVTS
jgi:hypothetical protein